MPQSIRKPHRISATMLYCISLGFLNIQESQTDFSKELREITDRMNVLPIARKNKDARFTLVPDMLLRDSSSFDASGGNDCVAWKAPFCSLT